MPATYEPIASTTLGSAAATIEFGSISGTFTDLVLVLHGSVTPISGRTNDQVVVRLNSDTGANYSFTDLYGDGSSAGSSRASAGGWGFNGIFIGNWTANISPKIVTIPSYANTNVKKTILGASADPGAAVSRVVGLWNSTSAITTVTVVNRFGANFPTGTMASLYGIKAA